MIHHRRTKDVDFLFFHPLCTYTILIDSYIPNIHVFINEKLCPYLPLGKRLFNVKQVSCRLWCQETTQVGHGVAHSKNGSGLCRSKIQGPLIYHRTIAVSCNILQVVGVSYLMSYKDPRNKLTQFCIPEP